MGMRSCHIWILSTFWGANACETRKVGNNYIDLRSEEKKEKSKNRVIFHLVVKRNTIVLGDNRADFATKIANLPVILNLEVYGQNVNIITIIESYCNGFGGKYVIFASVHLYLEL